MAVKNKQKGSSTLIEVGTLIKGEIVFDNEAEPLKLFPFKSKGHYNEVGYKKVSDAIINYLEE